MHATPPRLWPGLLTPHYRRETDSPRLPIPPPWLLPVLTLALAVLLVITVPPRSLAPALAFAIFAPALAWIDADVHRLPDALTRPATAAVGLAVAASSFVSCAWDNITRTAIATAAAAATMFALAIVAGVGLGDLKLAVPLIASAAWHSWATALWAFLAGWALNAAIVIITRIARRREPHSPLGPPLILGWILAITLSAPLS